MIKLNSMIFVRYLVSPFTLFADVDRNLTRSPVRVRPGVRGRVIRGHLRLTVSEPELPRPEDRERGRCGR